MDSRVRDALKVMKDFVAHGARRLVELFKWRWSVERLFSHGKEWLMLDDLRVRGLEKVFIYVILAFTAKLAVALATV